MPYQFKTLTYWVLITNGLVFIGAGHGVAPIAFFEIMVTPKSLFGNDLKFCLNFNCSYEDSLLAVSLLFLIGQFALLAANIGESGRFRLLSLIIMAISFSFLCRTLDSYAVLTLVTGSPFILLYLLLSVNLWQQYSTKPDVTD
jgi:hypothetical protein